MQVRAGPSRQGAGRVLSQAALLRPIGSAAPASPPLSPLQRTCDSPPSSFTPLAPTHPLNGRGNLLQLCVQAHVPPEHNYDWFYRFLVCGWDSGLPANDTARLDGCLRLVRFARRAAPWRFRRARLWGPCNFWQRCHSA